MPEVGGRGGGGAVASLTAGHNVSAGLHLSSHARPCALRYKEFIARVTPEEWFEELRAERDAKKAAMKEAWRSDCAALAQRKLDAAAGKQRAEHDMQWARTQQQFERAERGYREALGALREALALRVSAVELLLGVPAEGLCDVAAGPFESGHCVRCVCFCCPECRTWQSPTTLWWIQKRRVSRLHHAVFRTHSASACGGAVLPSACCILVKGCAGQASIQKKGQNSAVFPGPCWLQACTSPTPRSCWRSSASWRGATCS